jgi:hypothetical protein
MPSRPAPAVLAAGLLAAFLVPLAAAQPSATVGRGSQVDLEVQRFDVRLNDVQKPNDATGDRFSTLPFTGSGLTEPRLSVEFPFERWGEDHRIRITYAPLSTRGTGLPGAPIRYQGGTFAAGAPLDVTYRFDTWRATYSVPVFGADDPVTGWGLRAGGTLAVRDARIRLRQGALEQDFTNVGPVPLLFVAARRTFAPGWTFEAEADAFPAPGGGGLFDGTARLRWQATRTVSVAAGVRHIEGGAVDPEFYNYLRSTAATVSVRVGF